MKPHKILRHILSMLLFTGIVCLCHSCKDSLFITRKYTQGSFVEHPKSGKHHIASADQSDMVASIEPHAIVSVSTDAKTVSQEEVIDLKVKSILKKDSVFIVRKRGKDKTIVRKNDLPNVTVYVDENYRVISKTGLASQQKIQPVFSDEQIKEDQRLKVRNRSILALVFSFVPVLGLCLAVSSVKRIRRYERKYPDILTGPKTLTILAMVISIVSCLAVISALATGIYLFAIGELIIFGF